MGPRVKRTRAGFSDLALAQLVKRGQGDAKVSPSPRPKSRSEPYGTTNHRLAKNLPSIARTHLFYASRQMRKAKCSVPGRYPLCELRFRPGSWFLRPATTTGPGPL